MAIRFDTTPKVADEIGMPISGRREKFKISPSGFDNFFVKLLIAFDRNRNGSIKEPLKHGRCMASNTIILCFGKELIRVISKPCAGHNFHCFILAIHFLGKKSYSKSNGVPGAVIPRQMEALLTINGLKMMKWLSVKKISAVSGRPIPATLALSLFDARPPGHSLPQWTDTGPHPKAGHSTLLSNGASVRGVPDMIGIR